MFEAIFLSVVMGLAPTAYAQDSFTLHGEPALQAETGEFWENGLGSPTVVYDPDQRLYVMFFESQLTEPDSECLWGSWGVGLAYSDDGIDGWQVWPDLIMEPGGDVYKSCVVAHPTALLEDGTYKVWFKAHQNESACDDGPLSWGCESMSGVGLGWGELNLRGSADLRDVLTNELTDASARQSVSDQVYLTTLNRYLDLTTHHGELEDTWDDLKHTSNDWNHLLHDVWHATDQAEKNLAKHLDVNTGAGDLEKAIDEANKLKAELPTMLADLNAMPYVSLPDSVHPQTN